ncbi:hypothetical protein PBRA_006118 [Plasmodiophora brassicae]|uniref:AAA+ ATPase domain-containing protein n=1 Tax=Plasmodiophora brassicae TaxID=37360 RepID=A0A0G4IS58_PLABS|nr:hypothetical protein PBRA_006118 [Plasmodiophora brassicae]
MATARHKWIIGRVIEGLAVPEAAVEECLRTDGPVLEEFLTADVKDGAEARPVIFFYGTRPAPPAANAKPGDVPAAPGAVTVRLSSRPDGDSDRDRLADRCVYFVRTRDRPVALKVGSDETVLSGDVQADLLGQLEATLSQLCIPGLQQGMQGAASEGAWGMVRSDADRAAFLSAAAKFDDGLRRIISNMGSELNLQEVDEPVASIDATPSAYELAAKDPSNVAYCMQVLASWCKSIREYVDEPDKTDASQITSGPEVEIERWNRRMLTLTRIVEQLRKPHGQVVVGIGALPGSVLTILELLDEWRETDAALSDALNEAKDNVRFLENLRKFIEPLYTEPPAIISESLPAIMNSMKMIHTLSRHYSTVPRMTALFVRITNQLIAASKKEIYGGEDARRLWDKDPQVVVEKINGCLRLADEYQSQYRATKKKLLSMAKGKQFSFDEDVIFGRFERFGRRLEKLGDMFASIRQFSALADQKIDGMEAVHEKFTSLIQEFKAKGHDLLDYTNTAFERDFVEFTMNNSALENAIQEFIERSFSKIVSIEQSLQLLKQFRSILHREALQEELDHKYQMIFKSYGTQLHHAQELYEKYKQEPPIARDFPKISGNIHWSRQLLRRITNPMEKFKANPKVFHPKESRKIVKHYNKLARVLIEFETLWFKAWCESAEQAKLGLQSRLIVRHPDNGRLYVNFDRRVLMLMREAKNLRLMGFQIPPSASVVLLLQDKLKGYYNDVSHVLATYNRVVHLVSPVTGSLLKPHLLDLENKIRPGMTTMNWTSMSIESFLSHVKNGIARLEYLLCNINDIVENRIRHNLQTIGRILLVDIPSDLAMPVTEFVKRQRAHIAKCQRFLVQKNLEIERAVDDLIAAVLDYPLDAFVPRTSPRDINKVKQYYSGLMYHALLSCTRTSLTFLKRRSSEGSAAAAIFDVDLSLQVPDVRLSPSLDQVQEAICQTAREIINCSQKIVDWDYDVEGETRKGIPFYNRLTADKGVVVQLLLLTGAVEKTKASVGGHLERFSKYSWLWVKDPEQAYAEFIAKKNRVLDDFLVELHRFVEVEKEIDGLADFERMMSLNLRTENLKLQLKHECDRWKFQFSENLHQEVKGDLDKLTEKMKDFATRLSREVKDMSSLKFVMDTLAEIRQVESWIDMEFSSITERYNTLEKYLPFGVITKNEMDERSVLLGNWKATIHQAEQVLDKVNTLQGPFKEDLIVNIEQFKVDVKQFREEYDRSGPMVPNLTPSDAMMALNKFKREFENLARKYDLYNSGEKLFGLPEMQYEDLTRTRKELKLLVSLYSLWKTVLTTVDEYKMIPWSEVVASVDQMASNVEMFAAQCKKLNKEVKTWDAYKELSATIADFLAILPLLSELSKPSIRERHWKEISQITGKEFDLANFADMKLKTVLEANLLQFREDIEEVCDGADKQLGIEKKLKETDVLWGTMKFEFGPWKERGDVILAGSKVNAIIEQLEESQSALGQMLTMRHVKPFEEEASGWLKKLSDVNDVLESWIKVQLLWMSLEAVFTGGDIARQMPADTRVFLKVDKEWTSRLMAKAKELGNVVACCQNEYIKNILPSMFTDLESCQKALDGYLEAKRNKFPRFYFVSNPALLVILSQGSDKDAVQSCFAKVFDSIDRVEFSGNNIVAIKSLASGYGVQDVERIPLTTIVPAQGNIEDWLGQLEEQMRHAMKHIVRKAAMELADFDLNDLERFVTESPGQVALLGIQLMWTTDVQQSLVQAARGNKTSVQNALRKQMQVLSQISAMTVGDIPTKMERTKIETLVTIQVHQRDEFQMINTLYKKKMIKSAADFQWQKQLRCTWVPEDDDCVISVADVNFNYCYEYLGCKERLVVTPLTDRCYISLTQALGMFFGGAPAGPAGTGKTETVKDLGRALGKYVVVFNCSDQMRYTDTAKLYKGLCQSGSWGCFDEFNRIDLEVLSVVAQQIMAILNAMRARLDRFQFPGESGEVTLDERCGFFITMNPGYAGRQELPENLKALFRGVAMMVPDREIIMKVKLASVGYTEFPILAQKFRVLYALCEEQLSKQRHYDFGLRNILSVLRTAGVNLRIEVNKGNSSDKASLEEMLLMRTLRDMNMSKLVADDVPLFISLLHDLFPNQPDPAKATYPDVENAMREAIAANKLVYHEPWVAKAIQLYETSLVRHGLMMVGPAGGGKTTAIKVLLEALSAVRDKHVLVTMNPKAIRAEEMFGENDRISGEWTHGIFSSIWFKYNDNTRNHHTWICCDGPVDAVWIENLNTVLDDNKLLTLANGDRIPMSDNVRMVFEVENLRNASPATVSRAGIIFVSAQDLGYEPFVRAWLSSRRADESAIVSKLFDRYIVEGDILSFLARSTTAVMAASDVQYVTNCFQLVEALLSSSVERQVVYNADQIERLFLYALVWSVGGLLEQDDRAKLNGFLAGVAPAGAMPDASNGLTLYDYVVDAKTLEWRPWQAPQWAYPRDNFTFSSILVPTVDSVRAEYLMSSLAHMNRSVLITGGAGTAKTSTVFQYTNTFVPDKMVLKKITFSSATTARMFQDSIEADIEKRQGKTYSPPGGRMMTVFLDDLSMPEVNTWGDQPTLEIVRQLMATGGIYFLDKDKRGDRKIIENLLYVAAMSHPGGGRNDIPSRLKRHFFMFNMTPPSRVTIDNIYGSMCRGRFETVPALLAIVPTLTDATIRLWLRVKAKMLPTPSKFHYLFNMRDLSRIFQGILFAPVDVLGGTTARLIGLWRHECARVLQDKLVSIADQHWFRSCLDEITGDAFGADEVRQQQTSSLLFVDFLRPDVVDPETDEVVELAPKVYEAAPSFAAVKERIQAFLTKYNETPGNKVMDLVLFEDAVNHLMRISRIIGMPRGSALLVGVGGSGRQSLARLAAYIARHRPFQIELTRTYKTDNLKEDIKKLMELTGKQGVGVTFLFTDSDVIYEDFLEYINAVLATGEISGLFPKDERDLMCAELRAIAKKQMRNFDDTPANLYKFFIDRIRDNLHVVLCFSPASDKFAERARRFPALISGCTIDWFLRWPQEALVSVSEKFLSDPAFELNCTPDVAKALPVHIGAVHDIVVEACAEYFRKYRRHVYVTPKSYLSFIKNFMTLYSAKLAEICDKERRVGTGLKKLGEAAEDVEKMKTVLAKQKIDLLEAERNTTAMLAKLEIGAKEANDKKQKASAIEKTCQETAANIESERAVANSELQAALPFLRDAEEAAKSINKQDIAFITKLGSPPDLIKRIMDCVLILLMGGLDPVKPFEIKTGKTMTQFIAPSYDSFAKKLMANTNFLPSLELFSALQKDNINEETMELLEPYLAIEDFSPENAKKVSGAAEGLCKWVKAMFSYHNASLIVAPKLEQLKVKEAELSEANAKLRKAMEASAGAQAEVDALQADFSRTMAEKTKIEQTAQATKNKMTAANSLINGLSGERIRWTEDSQRFAEVKKRLVGDCALACAFVSYCGPFNNEFRKRLGYEYFTKDCTERNIPLTRQLEGLPKDDLSIQNGILVTQASRWPLLVDPQGQALAWLRRREAANMPPKGTTTLTDGKLRDLLEFCMGEGRALLIEGVEEELDPMLDPVLERNLTKKGRSFFIKLGDKVVSFSLDFRLYFITKLSNPHFSPELSAKTTVIDFAVTQSGLEDQLLSRVINEEQRSLEEQRQKLIEEVNMNTISLLNLDKLLLERLTNSEGNLLDDTSLIEVLADTKTKAQEVKEKIASSVDTEKMINKKREQYRPVATRGSVIYFVIVDMSSVNSMYQTSLSQFLTWFDYSIQESPKANLAAKRVENIIDFLTYHVYVNINRGLFVVDKLVFKLMVTLKICTTAGVIDSAQVAYFLRGSTGLKGAPRKPNEWLQSTSWQALVSLAENVDFFSDLLSSIQADDRLWKQLYDQEAPEQCPIPHYEERLASNRTGPFLRLMLLRAFRDDRTTMAANLFIRDVMGERYAVPVTQTFEDIWAVSDHLQPVILMLTPGADPTLALEDLAKRKQVSIFSVSMGEGQEPHARKCIVDGMQQGGWALLQNCHLGLGFMGQLVTMLKKFHEELQVSPKFRLWITCEPHLDFPISLLQMSIKVTNEPPQGMKAGLLRSYTTVIDGDRLDRVDSSRWRDLVFAICFLHSAVQERRKFGPVGWNIPYEFNQSDLEASLTFVEKHMFGAAQIDWTTVRYMVCEVQYGGRVTDNFDRILFNSYGNEWLSAACFDDDFAFAAPGHFVYRVPRVEGADHMVRAIRDYIDTFPQADTPEIFGLHSNADLTFGTKQGVYLIATIQETQPKLSGAAGAGKSREEIVKDKADELLKLMPESYKDDDVRRNITKRPQKELEQVLGAKALRALGGAVNGFQIPLNVTLYQEIQRLQMTITRVRNTLVDVQLAINGEIILTPNLQAALDAIFDEKPPAFWYRAPSGEQLAWTVPALGSWFNGLIEREKQLTAWLRKGRPSSFWLTGFFNPQGFLTAMRQEVTRRHKDERWALDDVTFHTEVTDIETVNRVKAPPDEGVYIHGLYIEGAAWDTKAKVLTESRPKEVVVPLPVLYVTAVTTEKSRATLKPGAFYSCPCYTVPKRTDQNFVFVVNLKTNRDPNHWTLRGVALLCSKE